MNRDQVWVTIFGTLWIFFAYVDRRLKKAEDGAEALWRSTQMKTRRWLKDDPYRSFDSPSGQWFARTEAGAHMLYLSKKARVTPYDLAEHDRLMSQIDYGIAAAPPDDYLP
ncbi:MAG: hypothetical protein KGI79_02730 [Patescibacteria group bacterium]|nr:hypothetical protein [Patescibacteria group bacterium]